ncbi:MAG: hypothetical protein ACK4M7_00800 [Burkholderiales bacterium]
MRQQVILNLGASFAVAFKGWKAVSDRVEAILSDQQSLFGLSPELKQERSKWQA